MENSKGMHETTIRMEGDLSSRLSMAAQLLGQSRNAIMVQAIKESLMLYESDPEYQKKRTEWIASLANVGTSAR